MSRYKRRPEVKEATLRDDTKPKPVEKPAPTRELVGRKKMRMKRRPEVESPRKGGIRMYEVVAAKAVIREGPQHGDSVIERLTKGSRIKVDMSTLTGKRAKIIEPVVGWVSLWSQNGPILEEVKGTVAARRSKPMDNLDRVAERRRRNSNSSISSEFSAVSDFGDLDTLAKSNNLDHDMTNNPYNVGLGVEVFSKTKKRWLPGEVLQMNNEGVLVKYANKKKWFLFNSKSLRQKQATTEPSPAQTRKRVKPAKTSVNLQVDVKKWSPEHVEQWLLHLEQGKYKQWGDIFRKNEIGGNELLALTKRDLKSLGLTNFSLRDGLYRAILNLSRKDSVVSLSSKSSDRTSAAPVPLSLQDLLSPLPTFSEVKSAETNQLFRRKLRLCALRVPGAPPGAEGPKFALARKRKREILVELVAYVSAEKNWYHENLVDDVIAMVESNVFRELPYRRRSNREQDEEEIQEFNDPDWQHLQLVYEFFHRFILSFTEPDAKVLKKKLSHEFLYKMILTFNSEDHRERDYLKTILHRIYGKFMSLRAYIRKTIGGGLSEIIYCNKRFNGVSELLEILGSIINGFAVPLKTEHKKFLLNVLLPLHKYPRVHEFHQHLSCCVTQFLQKDTCLCCPAIRSLLRCWPVLTSHKQILYIQELEEILEVTPQEEFVQVVPELFTCVSQSITSTQFQVAERSLFLFNNDVLVLYLCDHRAKIAPFILPALQRNVETHWNSVVQNLSANILKMFWEMDSELVMSILGDLNIESFIQLSEHFPATQPNSNNKGRLSFLSALDDRNGSHWSTQFSFE